MVLDKSYLQNIFNNPTDILFPGVSGLGSGINLNVSLDAIAMSVVVNAADRIGIYRGDSESRHKQISRIADGVFERIGINYPANALNVLDKALDATRVIRIFLDELFFTVLAVLGILSIILVSSLLMSDAEEKTFEYGILRSLGMQSSSLIVLLCVQSSMFAIPGIIAGLLLCYIAYIPLGFILSNFVGSDVDISLDPSAVALGIVLGLILPIFV